MFKLKGKSLIFILCLVALAIPVTSAFASKVTSKHEVAGEISKQVLEKKCKTVMTVDNENITDKELDAVKTMHPEFSNEQAKDEVVCDKLVYKEALKQGIVVTSQEIDDYVKQAREMIKQDPASKQMVDDYIKGLGLTEEEYWEKAKDEYKVQLTISKYKTSVEDEFSKSVKKDDPQYTDKYLKFYQKKVSDLKSKAVIKQQ